MTTGAGSGGAHILVVDDDEDILRLLSMRLRARGFRVSTAASAEEGLARIAVDPPRAVVSDVGLPGRDGLALFEEIRRTRPTLPVILLTAHGTIPDAVEATSRGVAGYLTKPFEARDLMAEVGRALALGVVLGLALLGLGVDHVKLEVGHLAIVEVLELEGRLTALHDYPDDGLH